jgi:hypothetical protein
MAPAAYTESMWSRRLMGLIVGSLVASCSGESVSADVTGNWCGQDVGAKEQCQGDEVEYLELVQSDSSVTGQICEAYGKDCTPIEGGKVDGRKLTFTFAPTSVGGKVDLELQGDTLVGTIHADKCDCELAFTFHRL